MAIPKKFRISRSRYTVERVQIGMRLGYISYRNRIIYLSPTRPSTGRPLSPKLQAETFWHEVTHAILKDMGHKLEGNEEFVDGFAKRLNDVVHSAEL